MTTVRVFFALAAIVLVLSTIVYTAIFAKATYESFREDDWRTGGIGLLYAALRRYLRDRGRSRVRTHRHLTGKGENNG